MEKWWVLECIHCMIRGRRSPFELTRKWKRYITFGHEQQKLSSLVLPFWGSYALFSRTWFRLITTTPTHCHDYERRDFVGLWIATSLLGSQWGLAGSCPWTVKKLLKIYKKENIFGLIIRIDIFFYYIDKKIKRYSLFILFSKTMFGC